MKAKLFIGITLLLLGFSSCKRACTDCTKTGEPDVRYCQKEYDSPAGYNSAIERRESWGYTCREVQ
jgi:hypothetical protein